MSEICLLPTGRGTATFIERGSRFLAVVEQCCSPEEGLVVRDVERRRYHDATHHVWAIRLADGSFRTVECAPTRRVRRAETRHVTYGFEDTGSVARALALHGAVRDGDEFSDSVRTTIRIATGTADRLDRALRDATGGRASLEPSAAPRACWIAAET